MRNAILLLGLVGVAAISLPACASSSDDASFDGEQTSVEADELTTASCFHDVCAYQPRLLDNGRVQGLVTFHPDQDQNVEVCLYHDTNISEAPKTVGCRHVSVRGGVKTYFRL